MKSSDNSWDKHWASVATTISQPDAWYLIDILKLEHLLPELLPQSRTLEVGCGSARLSYFLASQSHYTYGLDYSLEALRVARNNFQTGNLHIRLVYADGMRLPFASDSFDVVMSTGLLEHFADPMPFVLEMARVLKPGGLFYSDVVPFKFSTFRARYCFERMHKDREYPYGSQAIMRWLETAGLQNIQVIPAVVLPPLGLIRRSKFLLNWLFNHRLLLHKFDGAFVAEAFGFLYIALGRKTASQN